MTVTALQTIDRGQETPWSPPELGWKLGTLIAAPLPSNLPVLSDQEIERCRHAIAVYEAHPKGTNPRKINRMMTRLALAYPSAKLSPEEAEARIELYCDMLSDIDEDVLASAFRMAVQTKTFFPSIAEIRDIVSSLPAPSRMVEMHRLRALISPRRAPPPPAEPYATPEQIAAIKAEMSAEAAALLERVVVSSEAA